MSDEEYLFEKEGAADADIEKLERVLRPLGRGDIAPVAILRPRRGRWFLGIGALAAAAVIVAVTTRTDDSTTPDVPRVAADGPAISAGGNSLAVGEWVDATDTEREILVGDLGRVRLAARSRMQVRHVTSDETRLYLERGEMEATVSADARPRFFQVDTDAARCVDLGCRYTLTVGDDGVATVKVVTGQVAFETPTREVYVPAGAVSVARKGIGPGTPRFEDARAELASAFDAYDAAVPAARRAAAFAALATVTAERDTLAAWHLLEDRDEEIVKAAAERLTLVAGPCELAPGLTAVEVRATWKEHLESRCW